MQDKKTKDLVNHILDECEKRGLTVSDTSILPLELDAAIREEAAARAKSTNFTRYIHHA